MKSAKFASVLMMLLGLPACRAGSSAGTHPDNAVPPPDQGAYVGAYVDPPQYLEEDRITSFEGFERKVGGQLDIFHTFHVWNDPFPAGAEEYFAGRDTVPLISWAGTSTAEIVAGVHDNLIRERANAVKAWNKPLLLRWRWEMNRPNLIDEIGSPREFVAAWRHIHAIFRAESVSNVAWVWCPLADPGADEDFGAYYPGNDVVDWLCVDGYARNTGISWIDVFGPFLNWADKIDKPILVGEFAREADLGTPADLALWLDQSRTEIKRHPQVKAVAFFNNGRGASGDYDMVREWSPRRALHRWVIDPHFQVRHP